MSDQCSSNPWFGASMALVGVIVGYGIAMGTIGTSAPNAKPTPVAQQPTPQEQPQQQAAKDVKAPDADNDHIIGNAKATISLIEYSDFQCPFCKRHHPTLKQALDEYGDDVNWIYRHYPLPFHPNAMPAALASECVAEQGGNDAFWKFADLTFEKGSDEANLEGYAKEIGINIPKYNECVRSEKYSKNIEAEMADGSASGVKGTPGTFIYNNKTKEFKYISGAQPYVNIKGAIDSLL